jgi:hypothetical protein
MFGQFGSKKNPWNMRFMHYHSMHYDNFYCSDHKNSTLGPPGTCVLRHRGDSTHRQSVFYLRQACRFSGPFADAIYLSTHSWGSNLPARFWTSPPLLDGKLLRAAPRVPQRKKSSSCARMAAEWSFPRASLSLGYFGVLYCARLGLPETKNIDNVDNLCVALDGNVDANLIVVANISGQISSPRITLFEIGIPVDVCLRPHATTKRKTTYYRS